MLNVRIERINEEGHAFEQAFQVNGDGDRTVVDLLEEIQQEHDPTLAFRYSCRIGVCGTCTVIMNGKPVLSCLKKGEPNEYGVVAIKPMPKGKTCVDLVKQG